MTLNDLLLHFNLTLIIYLIADNIKITSVHPQAYFKKLLQTVQRRVDALSSSKRK